MRRGREVGQAHEREVGQVRGREVGQVRVRPTCSARMAAVLVLVIAAALGACDRNPTEDPPPDETLGTFEAQAGATTGGGFELMEGPATFEMVNTADGAPVLLMRLVSTLPNQSEPSRLDFGFLSDGVPERGTYRLVDNSGAAGDEPGSFVSCYRSPNFQGELYRSEAGELVVTAAGPQQFRGSFEMTTYTLVQTGPDTSERIRLPVSGSFNARSGETGINPDSIFACR